MIPKKLKFAELKKEVNAAKENFNTIRDSKSKGVKPYAKKRKERKNRRMLRIKNKLLKISRRSKNGRAFKIWRG